MKRIKTWHGCDISIEISLFEQGLIVRYVSKEKSWQCIYGINHSPQTFATGWVSKKRELIL